jgi:peptidyl-prolyl cis-trans isomerase SurA
MVEKAYRRVADVAQTPSDEEALAAKLTVLNDLIMQDLLAAKARALQIEVPDTEVEAAVAEARKNVPADAFDQELARRNLTQADVRDSLRRDLLSQKVIEREVTSKIGVSEQEVTAFFNANRAQFDLKEDAHRVAQIVITPVRDAQAANRTADDAATPAAATAKLEMLMGRLKAGTAFSDLAMDYSEDPESAPRGGDMGLVPASQLRQAPPALRDAVLKAEPGTVTVVSSNGGHIIVLVLSHEKAGQRDLSMPEVRTTITDGLRARKDQLLRAAYLAVVRNEATVENHLARRLVESPGTLPSLLPTSPGK